MHEDAIPNYHDWIIINEYFENHIANYLIRFQGGLWDGDTMTVQVWPDDDLLTEKIERSIAER
jgi:hypothetical protein